MPTSSLATPRTVPLKLTSVPRPQGLAASGADPYLQPVLMALALFGAPSALGPLMALAQRLCKGTSKSSLLDQTAATTALDALAKKGYVTRTQQYPPVWHVVDEHRSAAYERLLQVRAPDALESALQSALGYRLNGWQLPTRAGRSSLLRLAAFSGKTEAEAKALEVRFTRDGTVSVSCLRAEALFEGLTPELLQRVHAQWRWHLLQDCVLLANTRWSTAGLSAVQGAQGQLLAGETLPSFVTFGLVENLVHRGNLAEARASAVHLDAEERQLIQAACLAQEGNWREARAEFEQVLTLFARGAEGGLLRGFNPHYLLCLLSDGSKPSLETAQEFIGREVGSGVRLDANQGWGLWAYAIQLKLRGEQPVRGWQLQLTGSAQVPDLSDPWRLMLKAWLGQAVIAPSLPIDREQAAALVRLKKQLQDCGFQWLLSQIEAADIVYNHGVASAEFFCDPDPDAWRGTLALLQSLAPEHTAAKGQANESRIVWCLSINKEGALLSVEPQIQKRSVRGGWNKARKLSVTRLFQAQDLPTADAKVVQKLLPDNSNRYYQPAELDYAKAAVALIGHPCVVLSSEPHQMIELVEGMPELEVSRDAGHFVMRVTPAAQTEWVEYSATQNRQALTLMTLLRDSPERLRLVQMTPAQHRAARQMAHHLRIPESAEAQVNQVVNALASQFHIHADHAPADREVEPESRLRAELSNAGESLTLRLVVSPLGDTGPRFTPGLGRTRVVAKTVVTQAPADEPVRQTETVGTRRDLTRERTSLEEVLDGIPFLDKMGASDTCEWVLDEPQQALELVELLPGLVAVAAVDWPKGKPVRTVHVGAGQLNLKVSSGRDWFHLSGEVTVEEGLVLSLADLLAAAGKGKFIKMGEGLYAALTQELRAKLEDLAAVSEHDKAGPKVAQLAASWLQEILNGTAAEVDSAFEEKVERLQKAQELMPVLPSGFQATLRPYQEEGYAWMMRLAAAGFGACLADDMGLGKTLQALAVMLARAPDGPTLVVAPTSVCGNWLSETQRFSPALNIKVYGDGDEDRAELIANAGALDVVVVSYALMLQAAEAFTSRHWHTVVLDEAQAIKNASAKRTLAAFELDAGFRVALSGTPVENRLAELWSIMRFCNPGLLGTLNRFGERFANPIERSRDRDAQHLLRRLIAPFVMRRTKAQVLPELPPRTELAVSVMPAADEAAHYEALRRRAVVEAENAREVLGAGPARFTVLAQLMRLRRAACDPRLVTPSMPAGAKVQTFIQLAVELAANGHKTLVFSQFVDFLELLREALQAAGLSYQYLDGATPREERTRRVAAFQAGEGDFFLISLKAGGSGLNLTAADYVVIADPWWNPAVEDQAMGRAHRIGQQRPVTAYRLVNKGTVEEAIVSMHQDKRALAEGILDGGDGATLPSTADLIALMRG